MIKKHIIALMLFIGTISGFSQQAFGDGEWFKFRVHYGIFNASFATIQVDKTYFDNKPVYHVVGKGKSTGMLHLFFKVDDTYETYIDVESLQPYRFIRNIDEGGYTKDLIIDFDQKNNRALVHDRKRNTKKYYPTANNVHDMLSSFYYLRNEIDVNTLRVGDEMKVDMFYEDENFPFKVRFLGREIINTKFGKVRCLKFRPYVLAGRVFKEEESLTFWISDDKNKMPIKVKAKLAVGSLDADLDAYSGLRHPFEIIMDK